MDLLKLLSLFIKISLLIKLVFTKELPMFSLEDTLSNSLVGELKMVLNIGSLPILGILPGVIKVTLKLLKVTMNVVLKHPLMLEYLKTSIFR